jgi:uncharacterized membrane protein YeiH
VAAGTTTGGGVIGDAVEHALGGTVGDALRVLDLVGVCANAMLGGVIARTARLDAFGFVTLAILSGLGGGIIRDVLLQQGPPVALTDYTYILTALAGTAVVLLVKIEGPLWDRAWPYVDALALGCWAAAGAQKTLAFGLGWLPAILLGTITAVGGGAIRDLLLGGIPGIFLVNPLYATVASMVSAIMVVCRAVDAPTLGIVAGVAVGTVLRLTALRREWVLPSKRDWKPGSALERIRRRRQGT